MLRARRREHGRDRQGPDEGAPQLGQSAIRHGPYIVPTTLEKEYLDWAQLPSSIQVVRSTV